MLGIAATPRLCEFAEITFAGYPMKNFISG